MSQENVDLVRSVCTAWEAGDYESVDWQHPEIEFEIADGPTPGRWTGSAGITEGWGGFLSAWEDFRTEIYEYRDVDDESVLVLGRFGGYGKTSGVELGQMRTEATSLFTVRDGKVTKLVLYFDRERALRELGLSE